MFSNISTKNILYRGYLPGEGISGKWYTNSEKSASEYGIVASFSVLRNLTILNIADRRTVGLLRILFQRYIKETNATDIRVFDEVIKTRPDGKTERNTNYVGDTHVLNSLLYFREKGWLSLYFDGFGSRELPTELPGVTHHWEVCLFDPQDVVKYVDEEKNYNKEHIARLRMERKAAIAKKDRKKFQKQIKEIKEVKEVTPKKLSFF